MKTFETEKNNIPEGATHYWNETDSGFFAWWRDDTKQMLCPERHSHWVSQRDISDDLMHEIPKPETNEWKGGDRVVIKNPEDLGVWDDAYKYLGTEGNIMSIFENINGKMVAAVAHDDCVCICWMLSMLSKPESPEEKEKRERLESGYDLYVFMQKEMSAVGCDSFEVFKNASRKCEFWLAIVDKTNYRKGE